MLPFRKACFELSSAAKFMTNFQDELTVRATRCNEHRNCSSWVLIIAMLDFLEAKSETQ